MAVLKIYNKEKELILVSQEFTGDKGWGLLTDLLPNTTYEEGTFFVSWEDKNYETELVPVPKFTTESSTNKELVFYFKDALTVKPMTAYDIAVKNGFSGTEQEWVESIKGDKGEKLTFNDLTEEEKQRLAGTLNRPVNSQLTSRGVNKPMITFIDDDGRTQVKDKWEPILKEKKNKLTIATVTSWVENKEPTVIQWDEIHDWNQKYGVEFVSHTHEHKHAQELTEEEVEKELKLAHDILKREGLTYNIIVQPFGENTDAVRKISRKYYRANIGTKEDINTTPLDTFNVRRISLGETLYTTFEQYKEKIDEAIANNGWIIFKSHSQYESFDENQLQIIRQIIDYAREQQMLEVNLEEGLNYMGNLIDTGDYFKKAQGSDYFVMDRDGKIHSNFGDKNYYILKYNSVNINTPITDFEDNSTSRVSIVATNTQGFPNNSSGQLTTTKTETLSLSYQLYMVYDSNDIYKRRWDTKTNNWTEFEKITGSGEVVLHQQEDVDIEVPANTYKDVNFTMDNVTNTDNIIITPRSGIEAGLTYDGYITTTNSVRLRLYNRTSNPITTKRPYKITVIKNDTTSNILKGLKGDPLTYDDLTDEQKSNIIGNRSITNEKLADKSVSKDKTDFVETSSNLFNVLSITEDKSLGDTGVITDNSNYVYSDYIEVTPGETYTTNGKYYGYVLYDKNYNYVKGSGQNTGNVVIPNNVKYIRLNILNKWLPNFKFYNINSSNVGSYSIDFKNKPVITESFNEKTVFNKSSYKKDIKKRDFEVVDIFNNGEFQATSSRLIDSFERTYKDNIKSFRMNTLGNATSEMRIVPDENIPLQGIQEFNLIVYIEDVTKLKLIQLIANKEGGGSWSRSAKELKNGWNFIRYYSQEGDLNNWTNATLFRIIAYGYEGQPTEITICDLKAIRPDKAKVIMVNDHGYSNYKNIAHERLKALGVPTTFALNPGRLGTPIPGASSILSQEEIDELAIDPYAEFSYHAWNPTVKASKDMTSEELKEEMAKCTHYLKKNGLYPDYFWRAAFVQNLAPEHDALNDYMESYACYDETSQFDVYPFKSSYGINRKQIHNISNENIDTFFDILEKTHCLVVFYTHDISDDGGIHMTNDELDYFVNHVKNGVDNNWLEGTTYAQLRRRYKPDYGKKGEFDFYENV